MCIPWLSELNLVFTYIYVLHSGMSSIYVLLCYVIHIIV